MKISKIILSTAALVCALLILSFAVFAEPIGEKCGDNAVWSLDIASGVLTISGEGEVYSSELMPWFLSSMYVKEVVITEGITSIPANAFEDCNLITKVTLPASMTSIGAGAFRNSKISKLCCPCNCYAAQYASENGYDASLAHTFGDWQVIQVQAIDVEGIDRRSCSRCQKNEERKYPALVNPFTDVLSSCWYAKEVVYCNDNGLMNGTSRTEFSPNKALTREQFVMILAKIANADLDKISYKPIFTDVPDGKWYTKAVTWAYGFGITNGVGGGKFGVGNRVTRQELAVFLRTYTKNAGKKIEKAANITSYSDYSLVATWARDAFAWAMGNGIMTGTTSKTVSPTITATRAQVAVTVKAYCENILKR